MFLLRHLRDLHRKLIVKIAVWVYAICFALVVLYTLIGAGQIGILLFTFPFSTLAFITYCIAFMVHFSPKNLMRARKAARKARA